MSAHTSTSDITASLIDGSGKGGALALEQGPYFFGVFLILTSVVFNTS